jgi:Cys-tRNA(Pro)/Cys-tRNA(Cys) deacylase
MAQATPATLALRSRGISFEIHAYAYDPDAEHVGRQAAEAMAELPRRVLTTLVAQVDGKSICLIAPSDREDSMKKVAAVLGGRAPRCCRSPTRSG